MADGTATIAELVWDGSTEQENTEIAGTEIECHALVGTPKHFAFAAICIKRFPLQLDA